MRVGPGGVQAGFGADDISVQAGQRGANLFFGAGQLGVVAGGGGQPELQGGQLVAGEVAPHRFQLSHQAVVAAGSVRLALERPELAANFSQQILQADEAGLGRLEAALGLLLSPAVLQHPGRLLDDRPPVLGATVEDGVEVALGHDDVLLTAHAGVGQQLLDVQQPARHPVDRVLRIPGAEQRAGDRDFRKLNREKPGPVVDGQRHLGPAQCRAARRTGEDDVFHLGRAKRAGTLGTQDPGDGVDHIGFAAAVGADHDGHPGLEVEGGRLGERLETLEGEGLQKHAPTNLAADGPGIV